jgi:hypothetical protein
VVVVVGLNIMEIQLMLLQAVLVAVAVALKRTVDQDGLAHTTQTDVVVARLLITAQDQVEVIIMADKLVQIQAAVAAVHTDKLATADLAL